MNDAGIGLSRVQTDALKNLLKHVHRRTITCPFERSTLLLMGLRKRLFVLCSSAYSQNVSGKTRWVHRWCRA